MPCNHGGRKPDLGRKAEVVEVRALAVVEVGKGSRSVQDKAPARRQDSENTA